MNKDMKFHSTDKNNSISKYRLCFIETSDQIGGGQVGLIDILENLDYNIFEPWVVLSDSKNEFYRKLKSMGDVHVEVIPFTAFLPKKFLENQDLALYSPVGVFRLQKFFNRLKPALVHSNHLGAAKYGAKAANLCAIPNLVTMRCMYYRRKFYFNRFVESRLYKNADWIVFNSFRGAELFRERTQAKNVISIINGIKLDRFSVSVNQSIFASLGIAGNKKVLLLPARIFPDKGQHLLIKALPRLVKKYPDIHVVFLGKEDLRFLGTKNELTALACSLGVESFITWADFNENVVLFFQNAYAVVLPTYFIEGCPRVLLEALAAGTPILASRIDGVTEIIEEGVNGFGFPPKDIDALASAIEKLLILNSDQYKQMRNNCLLIARQKYDLKVMIQKYQNLYLELIHQKTKKNSKFIKTAPKNV